MLLLVLVWLMLMLEHELLTGRWQCRWHDRHGGGCRVLGLDEPPHVPGGDGAVRAPLLAELLHLRGAGYVLQPIEHLHALAHPEVGRGEHVRAREGEDHEHVDAPVADAVDHGEHGCEGAVVHANDGCVGEDAGDVLACEVVEVGGLARGDPDVAELVDGEREDGVGEHGGLAAEERDEAGVDGGGGLEGELLVEDGSDEGVEGAVRASTATGKPCSPASSPASRSPTAAASSRPSRT